MAKRSESVEVVLGLEEFEDSCCGVNTIDHMPAWVVLGDCVADYNDNCEVMSMAVVEMSIVELHIAAIVTEVNIEGAVPVEGV